MQKIKINEIVYVKVVAQYLACSKPYMIQNYIGDGKDCDSLKCWLWNEDDCSNRSHLFSICQVAHG